jgi:hypothetical protein
MIIAFLIFYYGYKAYKLTQDKKYLYFGLGFLSLLGAFVVLGITLIIHTGALLFFRFNLAQYKDFIDIYHLIYLIDIILVLFAYMIFIIVFLKIQRKDVILMLLLFVVGLAVPSYIWSYTYFNLVSIGLLGFIIYYQGSIYLNKKSVNQFLVLLAFILLAISHIVAIFQQIPGYSTSSYIIVHVTQLLAFISLLGLVGMVSLNVRKKK